MLKKRFSSWNEETRSGCALLRLFAAGRRSETYGRASCTKGRIFVRTIGYASRTNGSTAWLATSSWRNAGRSELSAGRATRLNVSTFDSVRLVVWSVDGSLETADEMLRFSCANADSVALDASTRRCTSLSRLASVVV